MRHLVAVCSRKAIGLLRLRTRCQRRQATRHRDRTSKVSGRGVMLMQMFMDEIDYNEPENAVTLVKKRSEQDKLS
jgi:anti-sigma regulatory factor (Ser/Thr protein kinase)